MQYKVDLRDVEFNLFEMLQIQNLTQFKTFENFSLEEFKAVLEEAYKFAEREILPLQKKSDEDHCELKDGLLKTPSGFAEVFKQYAQNGYIGLDVPQTYGGLNLPFSIFMPVSEFFTAACFSFTMFPGLTRGAAHLIENFGTEELAARYCPPMYSGEWTGTMCLTEAQAGSAVGDLQTSAKKVGEVYKIKGSKIFISCGDNDFSSNVIHLVLARIEGDPQGTKGISLFVVPKIKVNTDGSLGKANDVKVVNIEKKMGIHGSPTCSLVFGDQDDCEGYLVGEAKQGLSYMFQMMNEARLACGMQGMSAAGLAYQYALDYAKERVQGGNKKIIEYPDIKRMLASQKSMSEAMRALLYQVGYYLDCSRAEQDEEKKNFATGMLELLTPICKAFCSDRAFEQITLSMQVLGGYGYIQEYPIEQLLRDVKISSIYEGTNGIQALDLLGRKMALNGGEYFRVFYAHLEEFYTQHAKAVNFEKEMESFQKALLKMGQVAMKLAEKGMGGDREFVMLEAVHFLNQIGYVTFAWLLLKQAFIALPKLEEIWKTQNATEEEQKFSICENQSEARYYEAKVKTARFYISNILPLALSHAQAILSEDISALKIRF